MNEVFGSKWVSFSVRHMIMHFTCIKKNGCDRKERKERTHTRVLIGHANHREDAP